MDRLCKHPWLAAAVICVLSTHVKKLEVQELFCAALAMDNYYGHLSHFSLVLSAPHTLLGLCRGTLLFATLVGHSCGTLL